MDNQGYEPEYEGEMQFLYRIADELGSIRSEARKLDPSNLEHRTRIQAYIRQTGVVVENSHEHDLEDIIEDYLGTCPIPDNLPPEMLPNLIEAISAMRQVIRRYKNDARGSRHRYEARAENQNIGEYTVTPTKSILINGEILKLAPQCNSLLLAFLFSTSPTNRTNERTLSKLDVMRAAWGNSPDEHRESLVSRKISDLNVALRPTHDGHNTIQRDKTNPDNLMYTLALTEM